MMPMVYQSPAQTYFYQKDIIAEWWSRFCSPAIGRKVRGPQLKKKNTSRGFNKWFAFMDIYDW